MLEVKLPSRARGFNVLPQRLKKNTLVVDVGGRAYCHALACALLLAFS